MIRHLIVSLLVLGLIGCGTPTESYRLNIPAYSKNTSHSMGRYTVGIARVDLADYLDQPQIVQRQGDVKLHILETKRWAGSLDTNIQQALASVLRKYKAHTTFVIKPNDYPVHERYRIYVRIDRFDGDENGTVRLDGNWHLVRLDDDRTVAARRFHQIRHGEPSIEGVVRTQSAMIDALAKHIASYLP